MGDNPSAAPEPRVVTKRLKRVVIDHGKLLLNEDYFEDRCQAALRHYVKQHGHGHMRETIIHEEGEPCCQIQPWEATQARMRARVTELIKEATDAARRHG